MAESKQTVADGVDDKAKPSSEAESGERENGDDLNALLKEFDDSNDDGSKGSSDDKQPKAEKSEQKSESSDLHASVRELLERDQRREREELKRQFEADMKETVKAIRGEIPDSQASDRFVRVWLETAADEDPRLATAWANRKKDPKAFNRIVDRLSRDFAKEYANRPDRNVTEDREAVAAAVRGASTKTPEDKAPSYNSMSDADFAADVEKRFGFRPKV